MIKNLLNLFFPKICYGCDHLLSDNEKQLCTSCRHQLPLTNFHFNGDKTVKKVFYGRVRIEDATALLKFQKKGIVQKMLHNLKYRGHEAIGEVLGSWLGRELKDCHSFKNIDVVIPVPLYKGKLRKRGYNQVSKFAKEIAIALDSDCMEDVLVKKKSTATQVFKKRWARWTNSETVFSIQNSNKIQGKHILLVDDIITTGATIESCAKELQKSPHVKISVASMAIAE